MASAVRVPCPLLSLNVCSPKRATPSPAASWTVVTALVLLGCVFIPAGEAQTCPGNVPHIQGVWKTLPYLMPINPISATLLHNGQVLIVAGSENDSNNNSPGSESYRNAVWNPTGSTGSSITVQNMNYDVFCSGTVALPDGRSMIVGGTATYSFTGENRASIFDPAIQQIMQSQSMVAGTLRPLHSATGASRPSAGSTAAAEPTIPSRSTT
jgi:hypothetical protein